MIARFHQTMRIDDVLEVEHGVDDGRDLAAFDERPDLRDQVVAYRRRCRLMGLALLTGLFAAILLIASLMFGALDVIVPRVSAIAWAGTAAALVGFGLVISGQQAEEEEWRERGGMGKKDPYYGSSKRLLMRTICDLCADK
jgi:hypothetical protein